MHRLPVLPRCRVSAEISRRLTAPQRHRISGVVQDQVLFKNHIRMRPLLEKFFSFAVIFIVMQKLIKNLIQKNNSKIILVVLDGLGGLPVNGKIELEAAFFFSAILNSIGKNSVPL